MIKFGTVDNRATIRHLDMHDNVSGDSTSHVGTGLLYTRRTSLLDSRIYNNSVILPPHPDASGTGGNYVLGAMVKNGLGDDVHFENLVFENNRVEDLDDYSTLPAFGYTGNYGRELWANGNNVTVDNVLVRNSQQPNSIPETLAGDGISYSGMSYTLAFGGGKVSVRNVLLEDCDDGGIDLGGDSLLLDNVILRNVGRAAFYIGDNFSPQAPPYYRFRNVLIENVDVALNHLSPSYQRNSQQAVLQVAVANDYQGIVPRADFENVTVTGCDGMRHLFNFYQPIDLHVRNCLFYDNSYQQLVEWNLPITQDWQYNLAEEAVPGEGNLVGLDPLFDLERGVPYLSPDSPCVDAGAPDFAFNDVEDLTNPGIPLWPSLGGLRCDIGYTGGPHASLTPDTNWVAVSPWRPITEPQSFSLGAPWPNPFNPVTRIPFTLTRPAIVKLSVHNLLGQEVAVLRNGALPAGTHFAPFQAERMASGTYLVTLEVGGRQATRTVTLLR
ncbi:MAG: T9SS type A sorting domain-containing protein [Candidatus Delongbacteria bacterium]